MSSELYRLLLVDDDRIFRMGLLSWLSQFPDMEVVAETDTAELALEILKRESEDNTFTDLNFDLVILNLNLGKSNSEINQDLPLSGLELCQQLKAQYPSLPILLLSSPQSPELITMALRNGVEGYCLKETNPEDLIMAIRQVASGEPYLGDRYSINNQPTDQLVANLPDEMINVFAIIRHNFYLSGLRRIDQALDEVQASLGTDTPDQLSDRLAKIVLAGQARELQAARWLVHLLWGKPKNTQNLAQSKNSKNSKQSSHKLEMDISITPVEISNLTDNRSNILAVQASLWDKTVVKLQANLVNLSKTPLEIDILKDEKKRELLYIALRQVEQSLTELRFSEIQPSQLNENIPTILKNIWQETVINFFGKYYNLSINQTQSEVNVVDVLLKDIGIVQTEFLDKIPQIDNLLSHLLFETELIVNSAALPIGTLEAMQRAELILDNLIIQIANGVIQPLLNHFADIEEIKQKFYRYNLLATREIERFRNDLSWKYRLKKYITEPQLIFESRQVLFVFANPSIKKVSIYAPRRQELQQLEGIQLAITLVLELQDAISPRLKSAITLIGNGFVYILTNVIGRGIGLIGRGVIQGIGNAWQEGRLKK